jgi:hypothetical protein
MRPSDLKKPNLGYRYDFQTLDVDVRSDTGSIPTLDISSQRERHVIIAAGTENIYQGHPTTVLLPDGKVVFCTWTEGHGGRCGFLKRSEDRGLSWSGLLDVPENWYQVLNCPCLYRLPDAFGNWRLFVYAGQGPDGCIHYAYSVDEGNIWSPMRSIGLKAVMPFCSIVPVDGGKALLGMTNIRNEEHGEWSNVIAQSHSYDGGFTWMPWEVVLEDPHYRYCEPWLVRSPDGSELCCLIRENIHGHSWRMLSRDEGKSWHEVRQLPSVLAGDRHVARYARDGRLVVAFRDHWSASPWLGHFVAWVGRYEDMLGDGAGYRVKLLHSHAGPDCGYPGLEVFPDGAVLATTYIKYDAGSVDHSVVSTRFRLEELDAMLEEKI